MSAMAEEKRDGFGPAKGTWPNPKTIKCKDCFNRDKTEVKVGDRIIKVGITKSFCQAYPPPPDSNGKPLNILFQNGNCKFYVKDKTAT